MSFFTSVGAWTTSSYSPQLHDQTFVARMAYQRNNPYDMWENLIAHGTEALTTHDLIEAKLLGRTSHKRLASSSHCLGTFYSHSIRLHSSFGKSFD